MKTICHSLSVLVLASLTSITASSQQANPVPVQPSPVTKIKSAETQAENQGMRKIAQGRGVDLEINIDEEALENSIDMAVETAIQSVEIALNSLEIIAEPIEINIPEIDIDVDPVMIDIDDLDIDIEPIEIGDIEIDPIEIDVMDIDIDIDEDDFSDWHEFDERDDARKEGLKKLSIDQGKTKDKKKPKN